MNVLSFGEVLWDKIDDVYHLGGAPLNFAAHFVKCGGRAAIVSAVGNDHLGNNAIQEASALSVDTTHVQINEQPTGTVDVFLSNGQPDYTIHENVAFDFIASTEKMVVDPAPFLIFYYGSLAQRSNVSRATLHHILEYKKFKHVVYDINLRKNYYTEAIIRYSLRHCTVFKINNDEVKIVCALLYGAVLKDEDFCSLVARDFDIDVVIITAGGDGCFVYDQSEFAHIPPVAIKVVDAVGAGDAFTAGFIYRFANGATLREAARIGNALGAFVASSKGAIPDYSAEVKRLLL